MPTSGMLKWGIITAGKVARDFTTVLKTHPKTEHQVFKVLLHLLVFSQFVYFICLCNRSLSVFASWNMLKNIKSILRRHKTYMVLCTY